MSSHESTCVVRNDQIPTGEIDGEIVALDLERGDCFGMDQVGAAIWQMAEQPLTIREITDRLVESHEVERAQCLADILPFVDDMIDAGLLRQVD